MLKVSTKSTYAIRALTDLARQSVERPVRVSTIAERQGIPLPFLEQIFSKLRKAGLIEAVRGPQGGYKLSRTPDAITLAEIISVLEGPLEPVLCSMPENRSPQCHDVEGCVSRTLCNELDGALFGILEKNTLGSLVGQAERRAQPVKFHFNRHI